MTDLEHIERQLHDAAGELRVGTSMSSEVRRRINLRRLGTAFTGVLTIAALAFGATFAAGAFSSDRARLGPAQEKSDLLIEYRRSGGFEGSDARLTVDRQGDAVLHYTQGTDELTAEGTLSQSELTDLERAVAAADWPAIDGRHDLPAGVGVADGYEYEIRHDDYVVTTISGAEPQEIKPLTGILDAMVAKLRVEQQSDEGQRREDFAAIWPEDSEERAGEECTSIQHIDGHWRSDAVRTAERFATDVLGWREALATQSKRENGFVVYVGNGPISSDQPTVVVYVDELFGGCWSVISVSRLPEEEPKDDGSMTVRGREVQMRFDLGDAASAVFEVGYSSQTSQYVWQGGNDTGVAFTMDFEPRGTGHFLVLLRDESGQVFSAFGSPLPEGDFAAG